MMPELAGRPRMAHIGAMGARRYAVAIGLSALAGAGAGCAQYQYIGISSNPAGAEIYLDGERVGTTPQRLRVSREDHHKVFLKKQGYQSELFVLELQRAPDGVDFLTPPDIGVRMRPGNDATPSERDLQIQLEREEGQAP
jgi:hypothetical protein